MRAVVTGGAGFIGSTVVDRLVGGGAEVLVLDDLSRGSRSNLTAAMSAGATLVELDIRDGSAVEKEMRDFRPEVVFHLAAQIDVRASMVDPARDADINVTGSVNVFAAAHTAGARRVVNTSTGGAIYGVTDVVPTPETVPADPESAYGVSKLTVERYARWFRRARGLDVVTLRYGNVYGPRQDPRGDAGVIAIFCDELLAGRRPMIFGDGTQTRDYVYVDDVAAANVAAATAEHLQHDTYNVGTGTEVSVIELFRALSAQVSGGAAGQDPEFAPARPGELQRSCLDVSRVRSELDLPPATDLATGTARTMEWVRSIR
ncbi:NAD-dependent epimerase/dehydratase family protein [Pseudonocardia sp. TRM90224]|uniref:NAD-dependent epimerase/dehydratase family protein n=1 Tax=Pseudonocardia sp. TRM90224 TaxID=2812678 RepID=UPI001E44447D|nr:NAD-dependent epimerase/dehydratase family protein [Pseudonocardia sp. TRM90224]